MKKRFRKSIGILLSVLMAATMIPILSVAAASNPFKDVHSSDWFAESIEYVYNNGLMNGVSDNEFAPQTTMSRAMVVTVLYRMEGTPKSGSSSFKDVASNTWYTDAVAWASSAGVVNGYSSEKFGPSDNVTREQIATILYRYAGQKNYDTSKSANLHGYSDYGKISDWAKEALAWTNAEGLVKGIDDRTLAPKDNATRAQVATILMRFNQFFIQENKDSKPVEYITFGHYEQDNNTENGKEPIEWRVLDKKDGKVFVVSKYGLDCKPYNDTNTDVTWETCTLRKWLNSDFLNEAFSSSEKSAIPTVSLANPDNPNYGTEGGNNTNDQVFLLNLQEMQHYFNLSDTWTDYDGNEYDVTGVQGSIGGSKDLITSPTAYAKARGAYTSSYHDAEGKEACWWWLRSPGYHSNRAAYVSDVGLVLANSDSVHSDYTAVRPALWVNLAS